MLTKLLKCFGLLAVLNPNPRTTVIKVDALAFRNGEIFLFRCLYIAYFFNIVASRAGSAGIQATIMDCNYGMRLKLGNPTTDQDK